MTTLTDPEGVRSLTVEAIRGEGIAWIVLQGEADIATLPHLDSALERVELDGVGSVHLHVGGLDFVDTATIRRLTFFADRAKRTGHRVMTCGASPTLRKVARVLQVHDQLGLV